MSRSLPHVALEKWPDARPDALVRKYDTLSRKGAMAGVLRLSRAYWRDVYRRDLYPNPTSSSLLGGAASSQHSSALAKAGAAPCS